LSHRLIAAISGCLFSAVFVSVQIPAVRETVGAAKTLYGFIDSTVPSLGVGAIWIGFVLLLVGAACAWQMHRVLKEGTPKMVAVGSAMLVMAVGGLVAVVSTLNQHSPLAAPPEHYVAGVTSKHHRNSRRHHSSHHATTRPSSSGSKPAPTASPTPSAPTSPPSTNTPSATPTPSSSPAPSNSSSGSGGDNNTITVNKNNHQIATSGSATGENASSGEAKTENNEGPVNITIG
jgi:hypothetical protein